jgi:hypothetical protein
MSCFPFSPLAVCPFGLPALRPANDRRPPVSATGARSPSGDAIGFFEPLKGQVAARITLMRHYSVRCRA